jgi:hypothetical protein
LRWRCGRFANRIENRAFRFFLLSGDHRFRAAQADLNCSKKYKPALRTRDVSNARKIDNFRLRLHYKFHLVLIRRHFRFGEELERKTKSHEYNSKTRAGAG